MHQGSPHFPVDGTDAVVADSRVGVRRKTEQKSTSAVARKNNGKLFNLSQRTNSLLGVQIIGSGSYVPDQVVTNAYLEAHYNFDPGWIEQRTGIVERRFAAPDQATSDMCVEASRRALRAARVNPHDVDLVVVGTFTPDYVCPSTACHVQDQLGLDAPAFDVSAACSGFMYALTTAAQYIATGNSKMALVIGADTNSRYVNPADQRTGPLFGDGAGAVVLTRGGPHQGLICYQLGADGSGGPLLVVPSSGTRSPASIENVQAGKNYVEMDGRSVFKWAVSALTDTIELVLGKTGMSPHDVSLYLIHQANIRIIDHAMEELGIPPEKVIVNVHKYGNTSAGSIPLVLDEALQQGRISRGDTLLMSGFGAGLTWGTALFRW